MKSFEVDSKNALVLDLGNVVYYTFIDLFIDDISNRYNLSFHEFEDIMKLIQPMQDVGHGTCYTLLKPFIKNLEEEYLIEAWNKVIQVNPYVLELMEGFNGHGYILSNIGYEHAAFVKNELPDWHLFFSCEIGLRKPSKLLYHHVMNEICCKDKKRIIFVDDRQENLSAAEDYFDYLIKYDLNDYESDKEAAEALVKKIAAI
jgi:HAD superfamily hydrolase (TIGR01509 family)